MAASQCKQGRCLQLSAAKMQLPAHNFGAYPGLTFAVWFLPYATSTAAARVLEFMDGNVTLTYGFGRYAATSQLIFYGRTQSGTLMQWISGANLWVANQWRHAVWSLSPTSAGSTEAVWKMYIDGRLLGEFMGTYPANAIGTPNFVGDDQYYGLIDSVLIYSMAVSDADAALIFAVCSCLSSLQAVACSCTCEVAYCMRSSAPTTFLSILLHKQGCTKGRDLNLIPAPRAKHTNTSSNVP